jgi:hypothetical protein
MTVIISSLALAAKPLPLSAQDLPGLTDARVTVPEGSRRALDLGWWFGSGYEGRIIHTPGPWGVLDPTLDADNARNQLGLTGAYAQRGRRLSFNGDGETSFRLDSAAERLWSLDQRANLGVAFDLTRHTSVEARQSGRYAALNPLIGGQGLGAIAGGTGATPMGVSEAFRTHQIFTGIANTNVTHTLTRRSSVVLSHTYTYSEGDYRGALEGHVLGARLERRVGVSQKLRLGYRLTKATYDSQNRKFLKTQDIDAGFDYQRQLPFSPRTTLSAATGSSIIEDRERRTFRLLGDAGITHTLTPSWLARVNFSRPVQILEGMATPLVSTAVSINVVGDFGRRHRMIALVGYSTGRVSITYSANTAVEGYSAGFLWRTQLTRRLALNAEIFNGRTQFGSDIATVSSVPRDAEIRGGRVFLSYSRPVLRN